MFANVEPAQVKAWCESKGISKDDWLANLTNKELIQTIYDDCMELAAANKFNSLEKPKQVMLLGDPWTEVNEFLTPTFKMKRNIAKIRLAKEIDELYNSEILKPTKK